MKRIVKRIELEIQKCSNENFINNKKKIINKKIIRKRKKLMKLER